MLRIILPAILMLLAIMESSAYAASCEGQKGKVIFEDNFSDDSGGWPTDPDASFGAAGLTLRIKSGSWIFYNRTFAVAEGDFCVEAVLPKSPPNNNLGIALAVLVLDSKNYYVLQINSNTSIELWRKDNGNWGKLGEWSDPGVKPQVGSIIALRVVLKGGVMIASVNGVELKKLRVQLPESPKFGLYLQIEKAVPEPGATVQVKNYRVTAGE